MPNTLKRTAASSRPRNLQRVPELTAANALSFRPSRAGIALNISDNESCFRFSVSGTLIGAFNTYAERAFRLPIYEAAEALPYEGRGASS